MKTNRLYYLILLLVVEKIIQHIVVTLAFSFNWTDIASTVVVSTAALMVAGGIVAALFAVSLWAMVTKRTWSINLVTALALFDFIGEFVAQGTILISITVSLIIAALLLILTQAYRRGLRRTQFLAA